MKKALPQPSLWCIRAVSLSFGSFWGLYLFLAVLFEMKGTQFVWFNSSVFQFLQATYPGLALTGAGAVYGLVVGFLCGVFCGAVLVLFHNYYLEKFYCGKR